MKKLAIVALALVLAMTFVGCGAGTAVLMKGQWEDKWDGGRQVWEFKDENVFNFYEDATGLVNDPAEGTWTVDETGILEIAEPSGKGLLTGVIGTYNVDMSEKDTLKLDAITAKKDFTLKRVADAE